MPELRATLTSLHPNSSTFLLVTDRRAFSNSTDEGGFIVVFLYFIISSGVIIRVRLLVSKRFSGSYLRVSKLERLSNETFQLGIYINILGACGNADKGGSISSKKPRFFKTCLLRDKYANLYFEPSVSVCARSDV